jgi:alginate O-acetyltransferase complex protein AlgJ
VARSLGIRRRLPDDEATGPSALVGRDSFLFLTGDSNDVLGQHTGAVRLAAGWRQDWTRRLEQRMELMREVGAAWVYLVAPDKESVYSEKLPREVRLADRRPVHDFLEIAHGVGAPVIYPLADLQGEKESGLVYFETDTHWTALGCRIAYEQVCAHLARAGVDIPVLAADEFEWAAESGAGDLGSKLVPPVSGRGVSARPRAPRARLAADNQVRGTGRVCVYESDRADAPDGVIFGTCFANMALWFFKESFRRLVFVHTTAIDEELLRRERPDVVITMTAERGLRLIPDDRRAHRQLAKMAARKPATAAPLLDE